MSSQTEAPARVSASPSPTLLHWSVLVALLIIEVLLLTLRFDTGTLRGQSGWWAVLLGQSNLLLRLVIAIVAATLLLGGAPLWSDIRRLSAVPLKFKTIGIPLILHLCSFAAFARITAYLLESTAGTEFKGEATLLWCALGLAVIGYWALTVLPAAEWLKLARRRWLLLAAGMSVGTLAWSAGLLLQYSWRPLAEGTFWIVDGILHLLYGQTICDPAKLSIGTPAFAVCIAPECSGYEGMGLLSVFALAHLWLFRSEFRFPQALLLWPLGVAVLWLSNAVRIAALIAIGSSGWPEVALGGFHSQAGWLAFNAVALGLAIAARRMRFFTKQRLESGDCGEKAAPHAAGTVTAYLLPILAILLTTMLTGAISTGFDGLYPVRVVVAGVALWRFRRTYAELRWSLAWQPFAVGVGVFGLWLALVPSGIGEPSALREGLEQLSPPRQLTWILFRIVGATITVPLAEELAFRGYLLRRLQSADWLDLPSGRWTWPSLVLSSVAFGVLHGAWLAGTVAGLAYAYTVVQRGRLLDGVLAHATTNALLAAYVLATGAWALW
jgi:exosortase E/protease (VPEID-CTERM system)